MSSPARLNSSIYCVCRARKAGSLISTGDTTCASDALPNKRIPAETSRLAMRLGPQALLLRIHRSGSMIGRIGDQANICDQRLNLALAESIAVGRHERRL